MRHWTRLVLAIAAPLLLTGCFWGPGKFTSDLALHKDGSFVLDYRGEIVLQLPPEEESTPKPWSGKGACYEGRAGSSLPPPIVAQSTPLHCGRNREPEG
jgi:hypothetical protein